MQYEYYDNEYIQIQINANNISAVLKNRGFHVVMSQQDNTTNAVLFRVITGQCSLIRNGGTVWQWCPFFIPQLQRIYVFGIKMFHTVRQILTGSPKKSVEHLMKSSTAAMCVHVTSVLVHPSPTRTYSTPLPSWAEARKVKYRTPQHQKAVATLK